MCGLNYNPDPPREPEISWSDEQEIARLEREKERYEDQMKALDSKSDDEFTDEDSEQIDRLDSWIAEAQFEIANIYERYGIAV